jgi:hypothetical protein
MANGGHSLHEAQFCLDETKSLALGAGALGVGTEQGGLDVVGLGERAPDRIEDTGVGRRVGPAGSSDLGLIHDRHRGFGAGHATVDQRALARTGHPGDCDEDPERHVDRDVLEIVQVRITDGDRAHRLTHGFLEAR